MTEEAAWAARAAGLGTAWRDRFAEIAEAASHARRLSDAFAKPADETAEPLPAYAVPAERGTRP